MVRAALLEASEVSVGKDWEDRSEEGTFELSLVR